MFNTIFKTITLGVRKSIKAYHKALIEDNFLPNAVRVSPRQIQLDLVALSVTELGFKKDARLDRVYAKAKKLGLDLCPAEVGPALRLAYPRQPIGDWLRIAMEPIPDWDGAFKVFEVAHDGNGRRLRSDHATPSTIWTLDVRCIFVLPRK